MCWRGASRLNLLIVSGKRLANINCRPFSCVYREKPRESWTITWKTYFRLLSSIFRHEKQTLALLLIFNACLQTSLANAVCKHGFRLSVCFCFIEERERENVRRGGLIALHKRQMRRITGKAFKAYQLRNNFSDIFRRWTRIVHGNGAGCLNNLFPENSALLAITSHQ